VHFLDVRAHGESIMNPLKLPKPQKIALTIAISIGALIGIIVGYIVYAVAQGARGGFPFQYWISHPIDYSGALWALVGAAVGCGMFYLKRLS